MRAGSPVYAIQSFIFCRRGKADSGDEDDKDKNRPARKANGSKNAEERAEAWRSNQIKKKKIAIEYKTYEEIIQAAGLVPITMFPAGPIIDATGATLREVSNMASWTPSADPTRIPEIRHNVRLIVETAACDVRSLAKEGKSLQERKKRINAGDARLRENITNDQTTSASSIGYRRASSGDQGDAEWRL